MRSSGWGVEVRGLVCDPFKEALHVFALAQSAEVCVCFGEVVVGDVGVDSAVADGMNRDRLVAALALRDGVVVFDASAQRPETECAGEWVGCLLLGSLFQCALCLLSLDPALHALMRCR